MAMCTRHASSDFDRRDFLTRAFGASAATLLLGSRELFAQDAPRPREATAALEREMRILIAQATYGSCVDIPLMDLSKLEQSLENAEKINPQNSIENLPKSGEAGKRVQQAMSAFGQEQFSRGTPPARQLEGIVNRLKLWGPKQTVTWGFVMRPPDSRIGAACEQAVEQWQTITGLTFSRQASATNAQIRVSFQDRVGHYSLIGTDSAVPSFSPNRSRQRESLNIDPGNAAEYLRVALHEFGHAIGMVHEHQHSRSIQWDRNKVITHFWLTQGWDAAKTQFNVIDRVNGPEYELTDRRDPKSIMHYWFPRSLHTSSDVPETPNDRISEDDEAFVRRMYENLKDGGNGPGEGPSKIPLESAVELPVGSQGLTSEIRQAGDVRLFKFTIASEDDYSVETFEREKSIPIRVRLYGSVSSASDLEKDPLASDAFGGEGLLNARIRLNLKKGVYYVTAQHFHKTASSTGAFKIRVQR
jgi:hypothetical protein